MALSSGVGQRNSMNAFTMTPTDWGAAGSAIVLALIQLTVNPQAKISETGVCIVEYARPMRIAVGILWAAMAGLVVVISLQPTGERALALTAVAMLAVLFLVPLHWEVIRVRIEFDAKGIKAQSPWRSARFIPWESVERACFSSVMGWYVVQTRLLGCVRFPMLMSGVESFLEELEIRGIPVSRRPST